MTLKDLDEFRIKMSMDDTKKPLIQEIKGDSMEANDTKIQTKNEGMGSKCIINFQKINNCVISFI